ncbi:hypothetical protein, partial [Treponema sp. R6D11]
WKNPGEHIDVDVVYGNPFFQQVKSPYDLFELFAGFPLNIPSYHAAIVSDGSLYFINLFFESPNKQNPLNFFV